MDVKSEDLAAESAQWSHFDSISESEDSVPEPEPEPFEEYVSTAQLTAKQEKNFQESLERAGIMSLRKYSEAQRIQSIFDEVDRQREIEKAKIRGRLDRIEFDDRVAHLMTFEEAEVNSPNPRTKQQIFDDIRSDDVSESDCKRAVAISEAMREITDRIQQIEVEVAKLNLATVLDKDKCTSVLAKSRVAKRNKKNGFKVSAVTVADGKVAPAADVLDIVRKRPPVETLLSDGQINTVHYEKAVHDSLKGRASPLEFTQVAQDVHSPEDEAEERDNPRKRKIQTLEQLLEKGKADAQFEDTGIENLLTKHSLCFLRTKGDVQYRVKIELTDDTPVMNKIRYKFTNSAKRDEMRKLLESMISAGEISKCKHSSWRSPIFLVDKKPVPLTEEEKRLGVKQKVKSRLIFDGREISKKIRKDAYPVPAVADLIEKSQIRDAMLSQRLIFPTSFFSSSWRKVAISLLSTRQTVG